MTHYVKPTNDVESSLQVNVDVQAILSGIAKMVNEKDKLITTYVKKHEGNVKKILSEIINTPFN